MSVIDFFCNQDNSGLFDIIQDAKYQCFQGVSGYDTAFLFQIFIDRRTSKYEISNPRDRGGWICDLVYKQNNYEVGSKVYLKSMSRNTPNDLNELIAYVKDGLGYFTQTGRAKKISANLSGNNIVGTIEVDASTTNQYAVIWAQVGVVNP